MVYFVRTNILTKFQRQSFDCLFILLLVFFLASGITTAKAYEQAQAPQWRALLHIYNDDFEIKDPRFFLSDSLPSSSEKEFSEIVQALKANDAAKICRFPARSLWVQEQLQLPPFDYTLCKELTEFIEKAPAEKMAFVFASENISQPTSIMGHSFLKIEGQNKNGIPVAHAISFFTEIEDANFLRLAFESIITGKKGYYTLTPYNDYKVNYIFNEQRSLWEQYISLTPKTQRLLQFHLFELKGIEFEYFFHSFNCSTLNYNIIAVLFPEIQKQRGLWVTPKDVYKALANEQNSEKYIDYTIMVSASKWRLRALEGKLRPTYAQGKILKSGETQEILSLYANTDQKYLGLELAAAINDFEFENKIKEESNWSQRYDVLKAAKTALKPDGVVDLSQYKNPAKSPQDTYFYLSYNQEHDQNRKSQDFYTLGIVPASHPLMGNNSQYLSESELKVGQLAVEVKEELRLSSLLLFSARALQPSTSLYRPISGGFKFGYDRQVSSDLKFQKGVLFEGSLGQSIQPQSDIDLFLLTGLGYRESFKDLFIEPQVGVLVRLIGQFKLGLQASAAYTFKQSKIPLINYKSELSWNHLNLGIDFSAIRFYLRDRYIEEASAGLRYHF